jgi:hypothetical protein
MSASLSTRIKICRHCNNEYTNRELKDQCGKCYDFLKKHGSFDPDKWKKCCVSCKTPFTSKMWYQKYCTKECQHKVNLKNRRDAWRIENSIPLDKPVQKRAVFGTGHICKKYGYRIINKITHPNATKKGRIYEHVYVMAQHLERPISKGENIHHKNGVRNDNRIENLELWTTGQPAGQRVSDKISWCLEFLAKYGDVEFKKKIEFD